MSQNLYMAQRLSADPVELNRFLASLSPQELINLTRVQTKLLSTMQAHCSRQFEQLDANVRALQIIRRVSK